MLFTFPNKKSNRQKKVAEVIRQEIAQSFSRKDVYDPILAQIFITVQHVDVSPDLRNAIIKVSFLEEKHAKNGLPILNKLVYDYRRMLAKKLSLRVVPQLKFITDKNKKNVAALDEIWQKI
jgi:ribosome-binding factor A